eukprot:9063-Pelagococcus_subviridis.AAC.3
MNPGKISVVVALIQTRALFVRAQPNARLPAVAAAPSALDASDDPDDPARARREALARAQDAALRARARASALGDERPRRDPPRRRPARGRKGKDERDEERRRRGGDGSFRRRARGARPREARRRDRAGRVHRRNQGDRPGAPRLLRARLSRSRALLFSFSFFAKRNQTLTRALAPQEEKKASNAHARAFISKRDSVEIARSAERRASVGSPTTRTSSRALREKETAAAAKESVDGVLARATLRRQAATAALTAAQDRESILAHERYEITSVVNEVAGHAATRAAA